MTDNERLEPDEQDVHLLILVTNSFNEILLIRTVDEKGEVKDKWVCVECGLPKGQSIDIRIKRYIKENTQMEVEEIETIEPFEEIERENGTVVSHKVKMGFKALSSGDITDLGPRYKTAGWFTKQEIEWYWDRIDEDTRRILMASRYISEKNDC